MPLFWSAQTFGYHCLPVFGFGDHKKSWLGRKNNCMEISASTTPVLAGLWLDQYGKSPCFVSSELYENNNNIRFG